MKGNNVKYVQATADGGDKNGGLGDLAAWPTVRRGNHHGRGCENHGGQNVHGRGQGDH